MVQLFGSGVVTTCFNDVRLLWLGFQHQTFRLWGKRSNPLCHWLVPWTGGFVYVSLNRKLFKCILKQEGVVMYPWTWSCVNISLNRRMCKGILEQEDVLMYPWTGSVLMSPWTWSCIIYPWTEGCKCILEQVYLWTGGDGYISLNCRVCCCPWTVDLDWSFLCPRDQRSGTVCHSVILSFYKFIWNFANNFWTMKARALNVMRVFLLSRPFFGYQHFLPCARALIFDMNILCYKTAPWVTTIFTLWPWPLELAIIGGICVFTNTSCFLLKWRILNFYR